MRNWRRGDGPAGMAWRMRSSMTNQGMAEEARWWTRRSASRLGRGLVVLLLLALTPGGWAQNGMGLIPTPKEKLRGIPLASTPFSGSDLPSSVDLSANMPPPGY